MHAVDGDAGALRRPHPRAVPGPDTGRDNTAAPAEQRVAAHDATQLVGDVRATAGHGLVPRLEAVRKRGTRRCKAVALVAAAVSPKPPAVSAATPPPIAATVTATEAANTGRHRGRDRRPMEVSALPVSGPAGVVVGAVGVGVAGVGVAGVGVVGVGVAGVAK